MAKTLEKDTYCACCGELMKAGDEFRWEVKQVKSGSKVGAYRTAYKPAHVQVDCAVRKLDRQIAETDAETRVNAVVLMRSHNLPVETIAKVREGYANEFKAYPDLAAKILES